MAIAWPTMPGSSATCASCTRAGSRRSVPICDSLAYTRAGTRMAPVRGISQTTSPTRRISIPSHVEDHAGAPRVTAPLDRQSVPGDGLHLAVEVMSRGIEGLSRHLRPDAALVDRRYLHPFEQEPVHLRQEQQRMQEIVQE